MCSKEASQFFYLLRKKNLFWTSNFKFSRGKISLAEEGNKLGFDSTTKNKSAKYILGGGKLARYCDLSQYFTELISSNVIENLLLVVS